MSLLSSPIVSIAVSLFFFGGSIVWIHFFFTRVDPWMREGLGRRLGVTIELGAKSHWSVRGGGKRAFLIELLQLPCMLPLALVWVLWMGVGVVIVQSLPLPVR